jgi:hypothetical protein
VLWVSIQLLLRKMGWRTNTVCVCRFGGVIEQGAFQNAVFEAFVVGRVF